MKKFLITISIASIILLSCSKEKVESITETPGFGIKATEIQARGAVVELPVFLVHPEPVKGIQFTLRWDPSLAEVSVPTLTPGNPGFTVSSNQMRPGSMKVLVFSMQGDVLDLGTSEVLNIPVRILDREPERFELTFENPVFAGPGASSYTIPVSNASLRILQ